MLALMLLMGCSTEYTCTFDDPAVGDVFRVTELSCSEYDKIGEQIPGNDLQDCQAEAEALGGNPATCTCVWDQDDPCPGATPD